MIEVYSEARGETIKIDRVIGHIKGSKLGPTIVFFGGIHGNESSGVFALHQMIADLQNKKNSIKGQIYAIAGNLKALEKGTRYCSEDLNRLWTEDQLKVLENDPTESLADEKLEQQVLLQLIKEIIDKESGPFYFMDLHTTSSETLPFIVVNDSLLNRKFTEQLPVPMILGIEEYLDGPILSYINELGFVSFGYEAGQHNDLASYQNQTAFIYLCLVLAESIDREEIDYYHYYEQLAKHTATSKDIFEIVFRFRIHRGDTFEMHPGFVNFQRVKKGQEMAIRNNKTVVAKHDGRVFMPLYQNQGSEVFFEIRKVHPFFLKLSAALRKMKAGHILPFLPGIRWQSAEKKALVVNLKVARFLAKRLLHLLGYRAKEVDKNKLVIKNREAASRTKEYAAAWNK
ncbi:MAG: succinylglutamate desuccinylase/aspartoacylase family protein [Reichenbachiella sp.]|uniref:succinylglutamate desuccinylase/aspartoacylase family protein n=1 Tax=Reichenbachiella sp. TaxID=2184521 RepID=UPI003296D477